MELFKKRPKYLLFVGENCPSCNAVLDQLEVSKENLTVKDFNDETVILMVEENSSPSVLAESDIFDVFSVPVLVNTETEEKIVDPFQIVEIMK